MLGLQTSTLENQAIAYNHGVRQAVNEVLSRELKFYYDTLHVITQSASVLAGFSFSGLCMNQDRVMYSDHRQTLRNIFNILSALAMATNLLTACAGIFVAMFSIQLALRGGKESVLSAVKAVRSEYKGVLYLYLVAIELFIGHIAVMAYYKLDRQMGQILSVIAAFGFFAVLGFFKRAEKIFFLKKEGRFYGAEQRSVESSFVNVNIRSENSRSGKSTGLSARPHRSSPTNQLEPSAQRSSNTSSAAAAVTKNSAGKKRNPDPLTALRVLNNPKNSGRLWNTSFHVHDQLSRKDTVKPSRSEKQVTKKNGELRKPARLDLL